jgi:hypothetical protein
VKAKSTGPTSDAVPRGRPVTRQRRASGDPIATEPALGALLGLGGRRACAHATGERAVDFVGRYGGHEFLILLPSTDTTGAVQVGGAERAAISAIRIASIEQPITASAGVAVLPNDTGDALTLFRAADRALYAAKNAGRDRVHASPQATTPGATTPPIPSAQDTK